MSCGARRQAELAALGWSMQFVADEPRLSMAVQEYQDMGFTVHLEPVDPAACAAEGGCAACFAQPEAAALLKVIFTRPNRPSGAGSRQP